MPYTYDASGNGGLVQEGDYEATIERMERKTLPSGKQKLSVMYRIRSDVEQPYGNKCVFEDIWAEKENPDVFNRKRINKLLGTQEIEDGHTFETINDVIDFLIGGKLIVHIGIEFDNYHGEDVNTVSYYKPSKNKSKKMNELGVGNPTIEAKPVQSGTIGIEDDELPF